MQADNFQRTYKGKFVSINFEGHNITANSLWAGTVNILSGSTVATVSLTSVRSNSLIFLQNASTVASNQAQNYLPNSKVDGVSFAITGEAAVTDTTAINYMVYKI